jgi:urea transport system ATP-binding protein
MNAVALPEGDSTTGLYLDGVSVVFDGFRALNNLSLIVEPGELRAVIGPNGAGKTTMMDVITGKTRPGAGIVRFGGRDLTRMDEAAIANLGIGRKFQKPTVFEEQSVRANLSMALRNKRGTFAVLFWKPGPPDHARIAELAQDPRLLLVDEPAAGMTPAEREHTTDLLKRAAQTRAVVVIEHDMDFIRRLECRVTVLHEGSVLAEGSLDHVTKNQQVIDVYLGR